MTTDLRRFLSALLLPPGGGVLSTDYLSLFAAPSQISIHTPALDFAAVEEEVGEIVAAGENCYFGCALRRADLGIYRRGLKSDTSALLGAWIDFDVASPAHAAKDLPQSHDEVFALCAELPVLPTLIVDSGHGLHAWYLLDRALRLDTPAVRIVAEQITEAVVAAARAVAGRKGYRVDKIGDLARILRLPGTKNVKLAGDTRDVKLLFDDGPRHTIEQLAVAFEPWVETLTDPAVAEDDDRVAPFPSTTAAGSNSTSPHDAVERLRERLGSLRSRERKALAKTVLDGKPFAKLGERDEKMQVLASVIAFLDPETPPAVLARVLDASLAAMHTEAVAAGKSLPTHAWAIEKIGRAQQDARAVKERERAQDEAIRRGLMRAARAASAGEEQPHTALTEAHADDAREGGQPDEYSADELQRFAEQQRTDMRGLRRRWIIQHGDSFNVYGFGRYLSPIRRCDLDVSLPRDLAPAPIEWHTYNAKGDPRAKTVAELLKDHATVARGVVCDLSLKNSFYDERSQVFYEAACPPRPLAPRYHPQIDQWLRLLGGNEVDKLLAWIATILRLDRQSCALYLSGEPGTGKTMLALGLARLWTKGGFTELGRILDAWNSDLLRCPLVVADEHLPQSWRGQRTSAELRQLLGSSSRTLTRKHLPNADLIGALRLILLANNERMLQLGDEDLSPADLEAVAGRFLHIETGRAAADYLKAIGGRSSTQTWVEGDAIAEHALWLAQTVQVRPGERFLVEGTATKMHRTLVVQGKVPALAAEWIAKFICSDKPPDMLVRKNLVRIGNGRVLVNANALVAAWDLYVQSDPVPTTPRIGRALRTLAISKEQVRDANVRFYEINVDTIIEFAEDNQIGDGARMRQKIAASLAAGAVPAVALDS